MTAHSEDELDRRKLDDEADGLRVKSDSELEASREHIRHRLEELAESPAEACQEAGSTLGAHDCIVALSPDVGGRG